MTEEQATALCRLAEEPWCVCTDRGPCRSCAAYLRLLEALPWFKIQVVVVEE